MRKQHILNAALSLATDVGYQSITRDAVAYIADTSSALIANYYPTMSDLRHAVLEAAIATHNVVIVAQAMATNEDLGQKIPDDLKQKVLHYLSTK